MQGILLRGHGLKTAEDFHDVVEATGWAPMDYVGGAAVRTQLTPRVFTANESPASENIPFHHEMARECLLEAALIPVTSPSPDCL